jgi:hypothetical protein
VPIILEGKAFASSSAATIRFVAYFTTQTVAETIEDRLEAEDYCIISMEARCGLFEDIISFFISEGL